MTTLSKEFILNNAITRGRNLSWVQFLKSKKVAEAVADKVWAYLVNHGCGKKNRKNILEVRPSERFTGTWKVRVNWLRSEVAVAALQASYTPDDLVDQWSP